MINYGRPQTAFLMLALLLAAACDRAADSGRTQTLATGTWHAHIALPGGDIDVGLEISNTAGKYAASLINGQERVSIDEVRFADGELLLRFAAFNNEIRATLADGRLEGELKLVKRYGDTQVMAFTAARDAAPGAIDSGSVGSDLSGRWAVRFNNADGSTSPAIGEFAQRGARLFGTFLNPDGDYRYLAGQVRGNAFKLSTFDGAHAFVFSGTMDGDRIRSADFWSGTEWHQTWSAVRDPAVVLPDAYARTWLKPGYDRLEFVFPDLDGQRVSVNDPRFSGKVLVVILAGSWCPTCHDEARFLAALHREYRARGLEVVALMYEHFEDPDIAAEQTRLFRDRLGIEYLTLIAGISDKTLASSTLPSLNAVLAFPTTIFIGRSGRVRNIHTGFNGPGTGAHFEKQKAEFTALVTTLLAERPRLIESIVQPENPRQE